MPSIILEHVQYMKTLPILFFYLGRPGYIEGSEEVIGEGVTQGEGIK